MRVQSIRSLSGISGASPVRLLHPPPLHRCQGLASVQTGLPGAASPGQVCAPLLPHPAQNMLNTVVLQSTPSLWKLQALPQRPVSHRSCVCFIVVLDTITLASLLQPAESSLNAQILLLHVAAFAAGDFLPIMLSALYSAPSAAGKCKSRRTSGQKGLCSPRSCCGGGRPGRSSRARCPRHPLPRRCLLQSRGRHPWPPNIAQRGQPPPCGCGYRIRWAPCRSSSPCSVQHTDNWGSEQLLVQEDFLKERNPEKGTLHYTSAWCGL